MLSEKQLEEVREWLEKSQNPYWVRGMVASGKPCKVVLNMKLHIFK